MTSKQPGGRSRPSAKKPSARRTQPSRGGRRSPTPTRVAATLPRLATSSAAGLKQIAAAFTERRLRRNAILFREGDESTDVFVIEDGTLQVLSAAGTPIATLEPGSFVGEVASLAGDRRTATVRARTDAVVWSVPSTALVELLEAQPILAVELTRQLGRRLAATTAKVGASSLRTIVGVLGDGADVLAAALRRAGARDVLTCTLSDLQGSRSTAAAVAELFPRASVVVVDLGRARRDVDDAVSSLDRVVAFDRVPSWIDVEPEPIDATRSVGLDRAVRMILGTAVGVALSSGGSRTLAHIGVVEVLRELGVPIDALAGSSGGALVAAGAAAGMSRETAVAHVRELAKLTSVRRWDLNLRPRTAVMQGREIHKAFTRWFDGRSIEELDIPLSIVATDLGTGGEVVIERGPIADAVRASMSIPGVLEPWPIEGRYLIDGAVVNPLPSRIVRRKGLPHVVASNVAGIDGLRNETGLDSKPNIVGIVSRVTGLMENELIKRQTEDVDVLVRPRVFANSAFDFRRAEEFIDSGAAAARIQLEPFAKRLAAPRRPGRA